MPLNPAEKPPLGYAEPAYAQSLAEFGRPLELPASGGWLLTRQIPGTSDQDAMGSYPLFACKDWRGFASDLGSLGERLVAVSLVADPFGDYDEALLTRTFDFAKPFKQHFIADLTVPASEFVTKHHQYYARKATEALDLEACPEPSAYLDDWAALYGELVRRHDLSGIKAFSREAFEKQLALPGMVMLRASCGEQTLAAHLWLVSGETAYSHLAASSALGYEKMAAYALYLFALNYFKDKARWLHLGAGAGTTSDATDGLTQFKRGWSTGARPAYFCGRILNKVRYEQLGTATNTEETAYFPAYRAGEFA